MPYSRALKTAGEFSLSISQINKLFQNKGCNIAMSVVLGLAVASMLAVGGRGCGGDGSVAPEGVNPDGTRPVVTVNGSPVTVEAVNSVFESQYGQFAASLPVEMTTRFRVDVLRNLVSEGVTLSLARKQGVDFSPETIKSVAGKLALESARQQLQSTGKLKPGATDKELADAVQAELKQPLAELQKQLDERLTKELANPGTRAQMERQFAGYLLAQKYAREFQLSDADLRASYDTLKVKRITISPTKPNPKEIADKALAEIKSGSTTFEAAMDKYSDDPATAGKKKSDATVDLPAAGIKDDAKLKSVLDLKPGEVSTVLETPAGPTIYKLISKGSNLPADFDKRKEELRKQQAEARAQAKVQQEVDQLIDKAELKWNSEAWKVAYDYFAWDRANPLANAEQQKQVVEFAEKALSAAKSDPVAAEIGISTAYTAMTSAYTKASPEAKKSLNEKRIEILQEFVNRFPAVEQKVELAEAFLEKKEAENFLTAATSAAQTAAADVSEAAEPQWIKILGLLGKAEREGLVNAEQLKPIREINDSWKKELAEQNKIKAQMEADRKKMEEEAKKNAATGTGSKPLSREEFEKQSGGASPTTGGAPK